MKLANDVLLGVCEVVLCVMALGCLATFKIENVLLGFVLVMVVGAIELWRKYRKT